MAVGALNKIAGTTIEVTEGKYDALVRESEQLRILTNLIKLNDLESGIIVTTIELNNLIKAMEKNNK